VFRLLAGGGLLAVLGNGERTDAQDATPPVATLGDDALGDVTIAVAAEPGRRHLDAALDAAGTTIYFTATGAGGPGVFRVPADGGEVTAIAVGAPFVAPRGLAVAIDGSTLYVADPAAAAGGPGGSLFAVPIDGGDPNPVAGTEGTAPRAVELLRSASGDHLILAGVDPATGQPAVLSLPVAETPAPTVLVAGTPLIAPDGVAVASSGAIYVADRGPAGTATGGRVYRVGDGRLDPVIADFQAGDPAGIALVAGETTLALSSLNPAAGTAQVLLIDLATGQTGIATKGIGENHGAGGLHRARQSEDLAWADSSSGAGGAVYRIGRRS
jgi:hypothetical protein